MLVQAGYARGVPVEVLLAGTTLTTDHLADPDRLIDAGQELAIARNLIASAGDLPGLGVEAVRNYTLGSVGILGFALISSPTIRQAIDIGARYLTLSSAFIRILFEEHGDVGRVIFDDTEIPEDVRDFFVERDIAAIAQILPLLTGPAVPAEIGGIELRQTSTRAAALAEVLPTVHVRFGMPRNVFVFPSALLDLPLPQADALTAAMCERQCRDLLDRRQLRHGTGATVRSRLLQTAGYPPSMEDVADELNLDPRTLRRRLSNEGTSFRALLAEIRETLAVELLSNTGLTVEEVAIRLGYADTASFSHAFTRWRGKPPSHYRRRGVDNVRN